MQFKTPTLLTLRCTAGLLLKVAQSATHASGMSEGEAAALAAEAAEPGFTSSSSSSSNPLHALLRRLLPVLLRLASGSETVARQLFPELLRQMVRWYTRWVRAAPIRVLDIWVG